ALRNRVRRLGFGAAHPVLPRPAQHAWRNGGLSRQDSPARLTRLGAAGNKTQGGTMTRTPPFLPLFFALPPTVVAASVLAEDHPCNTQKVSGTFGYTVTGVRNGFGQIATVGQLTFHRDGTISDGKQTVSFAGLIAEETYSGTYTVNADCSGSFV